MAGMSESRRYFCCHAVVFSVRLVRVYVYVYDYCCLFNYCTAPSKKKVIYIIAGNLSHHFISCLLMFWVLRHHVATTKLIHKLSGFSILTKGKSSYPVHFSPLYLSLYHSETS